MNDLREDLDGAINTLDGVPEGVETPDSSLPEPEPDMNASEPEHYEEQSEAEETPEATETVAEGEGQPSDEPAEATVDEEQEQKAETSFKAPVDWSPRARENWSKLPPDVQEQITEREKHIATTLEEAAQARKGFDAFSKAVAPYEAVMRLEGVTDPIQAVSGLMDTANVLRNGSPTQKAQKLALMIKHYGIDIGVLDDALSGQVSPEAQQTDQIQQLLDQRLKPVNQFIDGLSSQMQTAQQAQQQQMEKELQEFDGEFFADLRLDMADLVDLAAKHGRSLSLQEAYDRAAAAHPEISRILEERKQADALMQRQSAIKDKQAAASSLPSGGQPATEGTGELSLREQLESAFGG